MHGRQVQHHEGIDHCVHADTLGANEGPTAGDGHPDADFHGDFFVARPLDMKFVRSGEVDQ